MAQLVPEVPPVPLEPPLPLAPPLPLVPPLLLEPPLPLAPPLLLEPPLPLEPPWPLEPPLPLAPPWPLAPPVAPAVVLVLLPQPRKQRGAATKANVRNLLLRVIESALSVGTTCRVPAEKTSLYTFQIRCPR
jgi:hypothetical protein